MFAKPFNPTRPFGTVHGFAPYAFTQDGQRYDGQKQPVDENGKPMPLEPKVAAAKAAAAPAAPPAVAEDDDMLEEEKLDLLAWAKDDPAMVATPWQSVRAAAAEVLEDISELKSKAQLKAAILAHFGADA